MFNKPVDLNEVVSVRPWTKSKPIIRVFKQYFEAIEHSLQNKNVSSDSTLRKYHIRLVNSIKQNRSVSKEEVVELIHEVEQSQRPKTSLTPEVLDAILKDLVAKHSAETNKHQKSILMVQLKFLKSLILGEVGGEENG